MGMYVLTLGTYSLLDRILDPCIGKNTYLLNTT